jgi:hypothetical protein
LAVPIHAAIDDLRQRLNAARNQRKIAAIRYHPSHSDNLIQAADMIRRAVYANYHRGESTYLDYIRPKISDLWAWRPRTQ